MSYPLLVPQIDSVSISPNPVSANTSFLVSITVTEIEVLIEPIIIYSDTFYSGQEEIL